MCLTLENNSITRTEKTKNTVSTFSYRYMAKAAFWISFLTIISKICGFGREMAFAAVFGVGAQMDAYLVASLIPTVFFANFFGTLKTTAIPVYTRYLGKDRQEAGRLARALFSSAGLFSLASAAVGLLLAPYLVKLLAPGFSGELYFFTVQLSRIMLAAVPFLALASVATPLLHAHSSFLIPAAIGFPYNAALIAAVLIFGGRYGAVAAACGLVIAVAGQFFLQYPALRRGRILAPRGAAAEAEPELWVKAGTTAAGTGKGVEAWARAEAGAGLKAGVGGKAGASLEVEGETGVGRSATAEVGERPEAEAGAGANAEAKTGADVATDTGTLCHPGVKEIAVLTVPVLIGLISAELNLVVDRILASGLAEGSISALNYAARLKSMPEGLFAVSLLTVFYPQLSRLAADGRIDKFKENINRAASGVVFLLLPMTAGFLALNRPMVEVLFQRGAFDARAAALTSEALFYYAIGLTFTALSALLVRAFYSLEDTRTPLKVSFIAVGLNIILNLLLIGPMAHAGLALATSLAGGSMFFLNFLLLRRKIGPLGAKDFLLQTGKYSVASLIMGATLWFVSQHLAAFWAAAPFLERASVLLALIVAGALIYGGLTSFFGSREMRFIYDIVRRKATAL
jgi:peptidoglycan biosynthesis protein MviN/MurJ (putative lipid II flippase)